MHYPLVGERVWVSGCLHEFIVAEADYATCIAKIFRSGVDAATRRCLPFSLLFAHEDFSDAQDGMTSGPAVREVLRASRLRVHQSQAYLTELR